METETTTEDPLIGMEIDLSNRDAWDDSALLSAFHASLSTHHTQGTPVPGDVRSGRRGRGSRRERRRLSSTRTGNGEDRRSADSPRGADEGYSEAEQSGAGGAGAALVGGHAGGGGQGLRALRQGAGKYAPIAK